MPWAANSELPDNIRAKYSDHQQTIFRTVFDHVLSSGEDESSAFAIAHAAAQRNINKHVSEPDPPAADPTDDDRGILLHEYVMVRNDIEDPDAPLSVIIKELDDDIDSPQFWNNTLEQAVRKAVGDNIDISFSTDIPYGKYTPLFDLAQGSRLLPAAPHVTVLEKGLLIAYGPDTLQVDGPLDSPFFKALTGEPASTYIEKGGIFAIERDEGVIVRADGQRIVWLPDVDTVPSWAEDADLLFAKSAASSNVDFVAIDNCDPGTIFYTQRMNGFSWSTYEYPFSKAVEEKRYTFGPLYMPDHIDAHGDFMRPDELELAIWQYVRRANRDIHLQHSDKIAGEWVNICVLPFEVRTSLVLPGRGTKADVQFPPGTAYMGVIWEPWAWELIKAGKLRGLSIGGWARRVLVEFDDGNDLTTAPPVVHSRRNR